MQSSAALAASLTYRSSRQAYWTIRLLVDRKRVSDAYRAYGYFRWLDDQLDFDLELKAERQALLARQAALIDACYLGKPQVAGCPEEAIVMDLIRNNPERRGELASYISNMMRVMRFDADRRGRLITQAELDDYQSALAVAVTDALHWFIGHGCPLPPLAQRYRAATGAHIVHMLRDAREDVLNGYFNIPKEVLDAGKMEPNDFDKRAYRHWVRDRVAEARRNFELGGQYLSRVGSLRCRLAGYTYQERFLWILKAVERNRFVLRLDYPTPGLPRRALSCLAATLISPRRRLSFRGGRQVS
jgi:phytoene/squalene synthetase